MKRAIAGGNGGVSAGGVERVIEQDRPGTDRALCCRIGTRRLIGPSRIINDNVIGMLVRRVVLEKPFRDMAFGIIVMFLGILIAVSVLAVVLAIFWPKE